MATAIIGIGNIGGRLARHLVRSGEPVVLAAKDETSGRRPPPERRPERSARRPRPGTGRRRSRPHSHPSVTTPNSGRRTWRNGRDPLPR
jgi:hypothetical protein